MLRSPVAFSLALATVAIAQDDAWISDFTKAKAQAKADKKDLLVDFTGSDWCQWCIKLDEEVFSQAAFKTAAPKSFVLVKLDFPHDESRVTAEIKAQNEKLQKELQIGGFPTILLMDAEGRTYAQTGYEPGGADKYIEMLAEMKKKGEVFQAAMRSAEGKLGAERAQALDEALSGIAAEVVSAYHLAPMEEILKLDADGKAGLKAKYEPKVKEINDARELRKEADALQAAIGVHMEAGEGDKALAKLEDVIKAPKSKIQHQLALFFKGMVIMDTSGDAKSAVAALEAGKALLPESPVGKRIDQVLPEIRKQIDAKKDGGKDEKGGK